MINESVSATASFVGERLTEARIARGLTKTQLADISGIKKQSISNYESGKQTPKADALSALTDSLGITVSFLQKQPSTKSSSPIFFRSNAGLAKREWQKAEVKLIWFEEIFSYLSNLLNFVPENIPQYNISNRLNKIGRVEVEEIAGKVRQQWGLGFGPISNITRLLENNGAIIIRMDLDVKDEDAFSQWQCNNKIPVVVSVAESFSTCRDRFTLAHELGHLVMHRNVKISGDNLKIIETQANQFASAFLMPASSYLREFRYPSLEIFKVLKEKWKTSIKSQVYRCKELRFISEQSAKNFYLSMAKRKWIKNEPLDDIIPAEEPKVIKEAVNILDEQANIGIEEISRQTSIAMHDIAQLCGIELNTPRMDESLPTIKKSAKVLPFRR